MIITPYHTRYFAHVLTRRYSSDDEDKLAAIIAGAQVDLNPHQVDAALFAFRSPLSKGAILADEVGLGKTIEAGMVIAQKWAERKRRILIITPASLRKQWHQELQEKFFLPCRILEAKSYNAARRKGSLRPFDNDTSIAICSYQFGRSKAGDLSEVPWDIVVIDEAHRLRNVYKTSNVIARTLKESLGAAPKLLLTATPLQNSLLELFGLVSFIDEHVFGDLSSFREQFSSIAQGLAFTTLQERLRPVCHRTLRKQVTAYVSFTKRFPLVEEFEPSVDESTLYDLVSEYLLRDNLQALPAGQRTLITMVLRKLLASSTFAIAGALRTMSARLKNRLSQLADSETLETALGADYDGLEEIADEWTNGSNTEPLEPTERAAIEAEIKDLDDFAALATSIEHNSKGRALLVALHRAFQETARLGAAQKAIIFTESRRTQDYLQRVLAETPYADGLVLFNGSNTDEGSKRIYTAWLTRHAGSDRITGSKTADMRSALVDYFRDEGSIMIATEAGAEGINLQFCSLVVNYDLPWNPQRIEQRIGRCHRYGQQHDVVVVNFINRLNEADKRVFELLSEKFRLFDGVFGASDEVLGAIESGVDFEKRIADIYQRCRRTEDIKTAFDQLQLQLSFEINEDMSRVRHSLLEHFDDEVIEKLRRRDANAHESLNRFERWLIALTRHELGAQAEFINETSFVLHTSPCPEAEDIPLGRYELPRRSTEAHLYRAAHPLADYVLNQALRRSLPLAVINFDLSAHLGNIAILQPLLGQSGWLSLSTIGIESMQQGEDFLVFAAITDSGTALDQEQAERLFTLPGQAVALTPDQTAPLGELEMLAANERQRTYARVAMRNATFFEDEANKIDGWADDLKLGLEREIKDLDRQIKEARRNATAALTLEEKLAGQRQIRDLEGERINKRRSLFEAQDDIDRRRGELIEGIEGKLEQSQTCEEQFTIRWSLK